MIYFLLFAVMAFLMDLQILKNKNKKDLVFYICTMLFTVFVCIVFYINENNISIAEPLIKFLNMEEF